jgi:phosphoglycolate phosphatase
MRFETVLFDLDGTLIDTKPGVFKSLKTTLAALDIALPPDETLVLFLGPPLRECFSKVIGLSPALTDKAIEIFRLDLTESGNAFDCNVFEGIPALLEKLKAAGIKLGVATSKVNYLAEMVLTRKGINHYFSAICGAPSDNSKATKTDSILSALDNIDGACPETSVLIGDRIFDAQGAAQSGISSIGVFYGYGSAEEIKTSPFTFTAATVADLGRMLLAE